jgi:hypothetical protein
MRRSFFLGVVATLALAGCGASQVPDPKSAADDYARAVQSQDTDALYGMLTESARKSRSKDDVRRLLQEDRQELTEQAKAVQGKDVRVEATARLHYQDGEETSLELRRSYVGLMRVLSPATRAAVEADLRSLVTGLDHPETLPVENVGDTAQVTVPGGHHVRLRRESGIWRVEDFD